METTPLDDSLPSFPLRSKEDALLCDVSEMEGDEIEVKPTALSAAAKRTRRGARTFILERIAPLKSFLFPLGT
jgi:hypothetical protein